MSKKDIPYYYWYEFLKRSAVYKRCCMNSGKGKLSALYDDFGNVHEVGWEIWWPEKKEIFKDWVLDDPWCLARLATEEEFHTYNDEYGVIITVDLFQPKRKLMEAFSQLIDEVKSEAGRPVEIKARPRGRPKFSLKEGHEGYQFSSPPHIRSLDRALKVYDEWHPIKDRPRGQRDTLYDIGKKLKLSEGFILTDENDPQKIEKKNKMTAITSRYYKQAVKIIENVEKGIFPKND